MKELTLLLQKLSVVLLIISLGFDVPAQTQLAQDLEPSQLKLNPARGKQIGVSTQGPATTTAVRQALERGGNLIDGFVVASLMLSVERPHSTGLTGGGFLVFREAKTKKVYAFDFRERAPMGASKEMFLDKNGSFLPALSQDSVRGAAVPGLVAGVFEIHKRFGALPFADLVQPAIDLAEKGFPIYQELATAIKAREAVLAKNPAARAIFLDEKSKALSEGAILKQKDLAVTLREIQKQGREGFYKGPVAKKFLGFMAKSGGLIRDEDFSGYKVIEREPVQSSYRGHILYSMPPPSSGGALVAQILNILEATDLAKLGYMSPLAIQKMSSAFQLAFADRSVHFGDPDFVSVPLKKLVSKDYAQLRQKLIPKERALRKDDIKAGEISQQSGTESTQTTHFSLMDIEGNALASTQTINGWMGAGIVVPGTGMVLNNEMDDFSAKPGAANLFGAVGGAANAIAPRKTPLSSMSPTILMKDEQVVLVIGAPGGTRIITCVAQTIVNWLDFKLPLEDAIASVRFHHQWTPDRLDFDKPGPNPETLTQLKAMGFEVNVDKVPCYVMGVSRSLSQITAVADQRDVGQPWAK